MPIHNLLHDPRRNKGTAFTREEREKYKLAGLLPAAVETMEIQMLRVQEQVDLYEKNINKYIYLLQLLDNNETLFFRTVMSDPVKFLPLVYTPTVGEACEKMGHIMRRSRGLFISIDEKDNIKKILQNWPVKDVRFIVVSDGERILGLGDLGVCGMGIPIGKLCLYTACAGVPPEYTLPIILDVGTNNVAFRNDPLYPGLRQGRVRGEEYDAFIEAFVQAIIDVFPDICIQWEDFIGTNAIKILNTYQDRICTFNDDIQGTAAVATGGLLAACRFTQKPFKELRFLFFGAGGAATGIANLLLLKMKQEGLSEEEARQNIWMFDVNGLLVTSRTDLADYQMPFAHDVAATKDLVSAIKLIQPSAIIGVSTVGGAFTKEVIETMSEINELPIIFPYSNPTSHAECTAEEAIIYSKGKAIFAGGSPFPPVVYEGRTFIPGQGNNVYIFPAMGLAIYATRAKRVTDEMFITAAESLSQQVMDSDFASGLIYPPMNHILEVSMNIAISVAEKIFESGLAGVERPVDVRAFVVEKMYRPVYRPVDLDNG